MRYAFILDSQIRSKSKWWGRRLFSAAFLRKGYSQNAYALYKKMLEIFAVSKIELANRFPDERDGSLL